MSDRLNYYFRQKVTEAELDEGFALAEQADRDLVVDMGLVGVVSGASVTEDGTPNLTVDVAAGTVYDKAGKRITWPTTQNVNCAVDELSTSTTVSTPGNTKILSLFVKFKRILTDPRTDGNGDTVYFSEEEGFEFIVRQGTEGVSPTPPALDSTMILIADITRTEGVSTISDADIDMEDRREDLLVLSGTPRSLRVMSLEQGFTDLLGYYNDHVVGSADKHTALEVTAAIAATWANADTISGTNVDAVLEEIVGELSAAAGAARIGAANWAGTAGTNPSVYNSFTLASVKDFLNKAIDLVDGTSGMRRRFRALTSSVSHAADDHTLFLNSTGGAFDYTLPDATSHDGLELVFKDTHGMLSTNAVTVKRSGGQSIEGLAADYVLSADYGSWTFRSNGANWYIT